MFSYPLIKSYVLGAQKNRLIETVLFEYLQHMFWSRNKKDAFSVCTLNLRPGLSIKVHNKTKQPALSSSAKSCRNDYKTRKDFVH